MKKSVEAEVRIIIRICFEFARINNSENMWSFHRVFPSLIPRGLSGIKLSFFVEIVVKSLVETPHVPLVWDKSTLIQISCSS